MKVSQKILTITLSILAVSFLTSCGTKKSTNDATTTNAILNTTTTKALASCNKLTDSNFSFNISTVTDSNGTVNADWIKVKFSYLSSNITQTGYTLRFFKWRVVGSTAQLDSTPLNFASYALSSGQTNSSNMTAVYANQVNSQKGFYIQLNDDANYPYQVIKVVAYKSDGTVLAQADALIPEFLASPVEYRLNSDGSSRADNLQKMHLLYGTDTSGWTSTQLTQYFQQYCF